MFLEVPDINAAAKVESGQCDTLTDWRNWLRSLERQPDDPPAAGRVLLISYEYPPTGGSGVQRPAKLAKYLPAFGWEVEVLTADHERFPWADPSLSNDPRACRLIHRVAGFEPACLARMAAGPVNKLLGPTEARWLEDRLYWRLIRLTAAVGRGSGESLWVGPAVRAALRRHRRRAFDAMISTGPPHFTHQVALHVHRVTGLPWLADVRDPLVSDFSRSPGSAAAARAMRRLERAILRNASVVVTTCPALADHLRAGYPGRDPRTVQAITNGFDPDDLHRALIASGADWAGAAGATRNGDCLLAAAGSLYGRREIGRLVGPLVRVLDAHPEWRGRVHLVLAGSIDAQQRRRWGQEAPDWLKLAGYLDHASALRLAASAACNIVMVPDCGHGRLSVPGKLFELLALPTHVLGLAPECGDTARILRDASAATVVPLEDDERIAGALERIIADSLAGRLQRDRDWSSVETYERRAVAARFADCLERVRGVLA